MSESKAPVDPLTRYIKDPDKLKDFRKALEGASAIVQGLWILSAFWDDFKPPLESSSLSIVVHVDTDWTPIATVLERNQYQLCAHPKGLLFWRANRDDLLLILHREGHPDLKHEKSWQKVAMRQTIAQGLGCFMTSNYAVLFCRSGDFPKSVGMERIQRSIVSRYNARSEGSDKQRWGEIDGMIVSVMKLSDLDVGENFFQLEPFHNFDAVLGHILPKQ